MLLKIANHTDDTTVLGSKHFWAFLSTRVYNLCIVPYIHKCYILAPYAFVRKNRRANSVHLSVRLCGTGVHCYHTVHFNADLSL